MKKLCIVFVMVFGGGGISMAQPNTASVNDNGSFNTTYINQLGGVNGDNSAIITQTGDLNKADVADRFASSLYPLLTGTKGIIQAGTGNTGVITQTNLFAGTVQEGPEAGIGQYGNDNVATITQSHNSAYMQEYAWVKQEGNGNTSLQNQASLYGFSHVWQDGDDNKAETQQLGGYNQKANIWQFGNGNEAYQLQGGVGYTEVNLAEISQLGNDNYSRQEQNGSHNISKTVQETNNNHATLIQNGNLNEAYVLQKTGNLNVVNLTQNGGAEADILQNGASNTLMGLGSNIMGTSLNGSELDLDQVGIGNTLHLQQTNGASAIVSQDGATNTSVVIQN